MKKKGHTPITRVKNPEPEVNDPDWVINLWLWIFYSSYGGVTFFFHNSFIFEKKD